MNFSHQKKFSNIRNKFPIFNRLINGKSLVYLDNAATSQKPRSVIDALTYYYETMNANVHRGVHKLAEEATEAYENTRKKVAKFINAASEREIIFTKNTTEAINLIATSFGRTHIGKGDEVMVSAFEHHSNLVPWQELVRERKAKLRIIPLKGSDPIKLELDIEAYESMLSDRTKLVCITGMSNALGVMPPLKKMIQMAHKKGALVLIDGAQYIVHNKADMQDLDCEFFVFSAHKMLGPTGVGVLYGKLDLLESMPPFLYGGEMVLTVNQYDATYNEVPWKFEGGTPNIADVIAFEKALDFINEIGMDDIVKHDRALFEYAEERFSKYSAVTLYTPKMINVELQSIECGPILSFNVNGVHPHDVASIFSEEGVCIRSGQHCAEPLLRSLGIDASARMSFYLYNTEEDVDRAEKALKNVLKIFKIKC